MTRRDVLQTPVALAAETLLYVGHELPADGLQRVDAESGMVLGHVAVGAVALGEHGEQHVVLGGDAQIAGKHRAGLADVRRLHQVVVGAVVGAVDRYLRVRVVMLVVVAHAHQLRDEHRGVGVLHLRGHEVAEAAAAEPVHVVDRVSFARQRVHVHPRAGGDGRLRDVQHPVLVQRSGADGGHLRPIRRVPGERHADVHHLRDGRIRRAGRDERHRRGRGVVRHHRLLHLLHHVRDVVKIPHAASALRQATARDQPGGRVVDHQRLVHVVDQPGRRFPGAVDHRAGGRVTFRPGHLLHHEAQVRRELIQPVHRAHVHAAGVLVHDQVVHTLHFRIVEPLYYVGRRRADRQPGRQQHQDRQQQTELLLMRQHRRRRRLAAARED